MSVCDIFQNDSVEENGFGDFKENPLSPCGIRKSCQKTVGITFRNLDCCCPTTADLETHSWASVRALPSPVMVTHVGTPVPRDGHSGSPPDTLGCPMTVRNWLWSHSCATRALPGAHVQKALPAHHVCSALQGPQAT